MKQYILILFLTIILSACEDTNVLLVTDAASDAVKAITLSDEDVSNLARHAAHESDNRHQAASPGSRYDKRLDSFLETVFVYGRQIISGVVSVAGALSNWLFSLWSQL